MSLAINQIRFELRTFRRNRTALVFTLLFPIMFLVIFSLNASNRTVEFQGNDIAFIQFFIPGIIAYGVIGACYTNLAMRVVMLRDNGVLKRFRGTPLSVTDYLAGHIGTSVVIGMVLSVITLTAGILIYDVNVFASTMLAAIVTLIIGAAAFCAVGLAMASLVPNADSAPALVNFSMFPILFISDVFYSMADAPRWIQFVADLFPIRHLANALQVAFDPTTTGMGFSWGDLAVLAAWGAVGTIYAVRNFRWEAKFSG